MLRGIAVTASSAALVAALAAPARGYDFEVSAQTIGQGYQERWLRPGEGDVLLNRRRFVQLLGLEVWNLLADAPDPGSDAPPAPPPAELYVTSMMRFEHDFGDWMTGSVDYDDAGVRLLELARDAVPELAAERLVLDVTYAYLGGRRVFGWLDFRLGRQVVLEPFDWLVFDGLAVGAHLPAGLVLDAHGGWVVRAASLWGSSRGDPDGTSDADCERIESTAEGWIPAEGCAQREARMPTVGVGLAQALGGVSWRVGYRRVMSRASEAYLADEAGDWGVNEELATAWLRWRLAGGFVEIFTGGRYNVGLASVDDAEVGVRVGSAEHALTPELRHTRPSFDLDSIFNVFANEATREARITYDMWPGKGPLRAYARAGLRLTRVDDVDESGETDWGTSDALAAGARVRLGARGVVRLDVYRETGMGGRRHGVDVAGRALVLRDLSLEGRVTALSYARSALATVPGETLALEGGARWLMVPGVSLSVLTELNLHEDDTDDARVLGVLDLAFRPEL